MNEKRLYENAMKMTEILKMPVQNIATFGPTNIEYYFLSEVDDGTRVREGRVLSQRPEIIRPASIAELFEGFGENTPELAEEIFNRMKRNPRILNYKFSNIPGSTSRYTDPFYEVFKRIQGDIEKNERNLASVVKGNDDTWQISMMKFIVDMTLRSAGENMSDLEDKGLFPDEYGVPEYIRNKIKYLFKEAKKDKTRVSELGKLLNDNGLFKEYEDRFFKLFK
ncbi:hypothetical protein ACFLUV_00375 [Elusimicrobiota bacterium]